MAFTVSDFEDMLRILEQNPEWRARLRQAVLTDELLDLPRKVDRLVEAVSKLAEAQQRTDETVAQLVQAQQRTDETVAQLVQAQQRTDEIVRELVQISRDALRRLERLENWQMGETGRRDGERFERETLARAPALFFGGRGGGAGEPHIREKVGDWLLPLYRQGVEVPPHDDPLLADILWWKDDRVMVVEVGLKVGVNDVRRAIARARTLQQVGVNATPVVIGEEWGTPDTEALAQQEGVEWYVRGGLSKGFLEFRRLGNGTEQATPS